MNFNELALNSILQPGGAFKADPGQGQSGKKRYYFVLNHEPQTDLVLLLTSSTTQFEEHQHCKGGDDVHISLSSDDYDGFTEHCLICCDRIEKVSKSILINRLKQVDFEYLKSLPDDLFDKIKKGVMKTNTLEQKYKDMILGSIDPIEDF